MFHKVEIKSYYSIQPTNVYYDRNTFKGYGIIIDNIPINGWWMTYKIDIYVCHYDLYNELAIMRQILHGHNNSIVSEWNFFNESFLGYCFVMSDND